MAFLESPEPGNRNMNGTEAPKMTDEEREAFLYGGV
jgi:hypothetical protein